MSLTIATGEQLGTRLLAAAGMRPEHAAVTARCIVLADAWGVASHGLMRLPYYLRRMHAGGYPPGAALTTVTDTGPLLALDGGGGLGHWQLWHAAELAVQRCAQFGIAAVSVANSGHCGALGVYTTPGLAAGVLTLVFSNGPAVMPAWGGARPLLSTSPIAAGIPTRPEPTIVDMATSAVARGKIAARAARGEQLPDGWALDSAGRPTVDAQEALHGLLAPLGGAKGFALALVVEAIAGGLAGPNLSADVPDMFAAADDALPQRIGHVLIMLDPARFDGSGDLARQRLDRLATAVIASRGRLPGSRRQLPDDLDPNDPLAVAPATMEALTTWAARLGVAMPAEPAERT